MAEVYEARRAGVHGFSKRLAIKRVLPQLAGDERVVQTFCDEATNLAALAHPNLVQVVDFGEVNGEPYMVMEYIDGISGDQLVSAVRVRQRTVELGAALHIASEVLSALHSCSSGITSGRAAGA
jgi:serine/threonine-protein kinase